MSFDKDIQKYNINNLNLFLDHTIAQKVNNSGGRKFALWTHEGTYIVSLKQIIKAAQCIARKTYQPEADQIQHILDRIRDLDKEGNDQLEKANLWAKIMTALRSFFGNIGFSKEKALTQLEKLSKKASSAKEEQLHSQTSDDEDMGAESAESTDREGPQMDGSSSEENSDIEEIPKSKGNMQIGSSTSTMTSEIVILPREKETKIDVTLHSTVFKEGIPVDVELYQVGNDGTFRLYHGDRSIGMINLITRGTHIEINVYGTSRDYENVDNALREIAVRQSFNEGFKGLVKIHLYEPRDNVSYFKFGFRYEQPLERTLGTSIKDAYPLFKDYFSAVKEERDLSAILDQIAKTESRSMLAALEILKEEAEIELRRPPNDLKEAIDNGFYIDWNIVLDRVYNHPEEKRNASRYNNVEEHNRGGWMYLGDDAREYWRGIIDG